MTAGISIPKLLGELEAYIERPGDWDYLTELERKEHPHAMLVGAIQQAYIRTVAQQAVEQALIPRVPLGIFSAKEVKEREAPKWIVPGIVQESGITELAGPGGIGKSFFCIAIANAVATGLPFFGRDVVKGRVLYIAGEGTAAFGNRLKAWDDVHGDIVPADGVEYIEEGVNFADDSGVDQLSDRIAARQFKLIIVDTFSQLSGVTNENDAAGTADFFRRMKRLRDIHPGSAVLVVHHMNAGGTKARGSTVHRDNVDILAIARGGSEGFSISTRFEHGAKIKDGQQEEWSGFSLQPRLDSAVVVNDGGGLKPVSPHWVTVRDILADGLQHPSAELYKACGIDSTKDAGYKTWQRDMASWTRSELLTKTGSTSNVMYSMTPLPTVDELKAEREAEIRADEREREARHAYVAALPVTPGPPAPVAPADLFNGVERT